MGNVTMVIYRITEVDAILVNSEDITSNAISLCFLVNMYINVLDTEQDSLSSFEKRTTITLVMIPPPTRYPRYQKNKD